MEPLAAGVARRGEGMGGLVIVMVMVAVMRGERRETELGHGLRCHCHFLFEVATLCVKEVRLRVKWK